MTIKKSLSLLFAAALALSLWGCASAQPEPAAPADSPAATETPLETQAPATEAPVATPEPVAVTLYVGDDNAEFLLPTDCEIVALTPQAIVDKLLELGVFSAPVTVNSFDLGSANIIDIDLDGAFAQQIMQMGTAGEYIMMGSLVNSFLSAYGADGLDLTVNGETLETGHSIYDQTLIFYQS